MSAKRVSSPQRKSRTSGLKTSKKAASKSTKKTTSTKKTAVLFDSSTSGSRLLQKGMKSLHFMGVCLGGGKTDKTCLALVEYYPDQNKVFLSRLFERVKSEGEVSADQLLHQIVMEHKDELHSLAFDVPLTLPKCMLCNLVCPGYEKCTEEEIQWMWKHYRKRNQTKRPQKLFTPYTERCTELYLGTEMEEIFHPSHALGANLAPLVARARFISRRLRVPMMEVNPRVSLWRIGRSLNVQKSYLRAHRHSIDGENIRRSILDKLIEKDIAFLYVQDARAMTESNQAFEAFLCALTAVLEYRGQTEKRPSDFPQGESWTQIPVEKIDWKD